MRTKAVYVLTSTPEDFYYEQLFISVYSLKYYNPDMKIVLVTDESTNSTFGPGRCKLKEYFDEIVVVDIPKQFNQMQCSRYLKTTLRNWVAGDFLFIDTDTLICDSLSEMDSFNCEVGAVPDCHRFDFCYYNSGVIFSKDTPKAHRLYEQWHKNWLVEVAKGHSRDQDRLNEANKTLDHFICEIPPIWNCQITSGGEIYISEAKVVHFFLSGTMDEFSCIFLEKTIYRIVKDLDCIPKFLASDIQRARHIFQKSYWQKEIGFYSNNLASAHAYYPGLFKCLDKLCRIGLFVLTKRDWLIYKIKGRYLGRFVHHYE